VQEVPQLHFVFHRTQFVKPWGSSHLVWQSIRFIYSLSVVLWMALLTRGVKIQFCSEAERTSGDVGGNPQQEMTCRSFEWFVGLFLGHYFTKERGRLLH
jgi:hypothetical protein